MEKNTEAVESLSIQSTVVQHALINGMTLPTVSQLTALLIVSLRNGLTGVIALRTVVLVSRDVLEAFLCKLSMEVKYVKVLGKSKLPVSSGPAQSTVKSVTGQTRENVT